MLNNIKVVKIEEFIYEFYQTKTVKTKDAEDVEIEELLATIDERELGNQMLMLTNQLKELININNAIINLKIELSKVTEK